MPGIAPDSRRRLLFSIRGLRPLQLAAFFLESRLVAACFPDFNVADLLRIDWLDRIALLASSAAAGFEA